MEVGDRVQIIRIPDHLPDDEIRELELCLGRVFPISEIDEYGLVTLEIGEIHGKIASTDIISIHPDCVEPVF